MEYSKSLNNQNPRAPLSPSPHHRRHSSILRPDDDPIGYIRDKLLSSLESPGIQGPTVGAIDYKAITIDALTEAMRLKVSNIYTSLTDGMGSILTSPSVDASEDTLSPKSPQTNITIEDLESLFLFTQLMLDLRVGFLRQDWDNIPSMLEKVMSLSSSGKVCNIPEACRLEIQTIRYEVENKWIISSIRSALLQGKLDIIKAQRAATTPMSPKRRASMKNNLEISLDKSDKQIVVEGQVLDGGQFNFADISYANIQNCLEACKVILPRTAEASLLVHTAEIIMELRVMILEAQDHEDIWRNIYDKASFHLSSDNSLIVSPIVYPELKLMRLAASDFLQCYKLENALGSGNVCGNDPGDIDVSLIGINDIDEALAYSESVSIRTYKSKPLLQYCNTLKSLRQLILRSHDDTTAWKHVRETLAEFQRNPPAILSQSQAMLRCREELQFIDYAAQVSGIRERLEESCRRSITVFSARNTISIDQIESHQSSLRFDVATVSESSSTSNISSLPNHQFPYLMETLSNHQTLQLADLETIREVATNMTFSSRTLEEYIDCVECLHRLRKALIEYDFTALAQMLIGEESDMDLSSNIATKRLLSTLELTRREFIYITREYYNILSFAQLQNQLYPIDETIYSEYRLKSLKQAIDKIDTYNVTCLASQQLLECSKYVFLLRKGIFLQDSEEITKVLRWFESNSHRCPNAILQEVEKSYNRHQNDLLVTGFKYALTHGGLSLNEAASQSGQYSMKPKTSNYLNIDIPELETLIEEAKSVNEISEEADELMKAARIILNIRKLQKDRNTNELKTFLRSLTFRKDIHPLILDEIAKARTDVDNEVVINALLKAINSFDDSDMSMPLNFTMDKVFPSNNQAIDRDMGRSSDISTNSPLTTQKHRRYSYKNVFERADIDFNSINLEVFDQAIQFAKDTGLASHEARNLYKTVFILREMRDAMKKNDWTRVEDIIMALKSGDSDTFPASIPYSKEGSATYGDIHPTSWRELEAAEKLLEIRSAIVEISRALKSGVAKCNNGVVDTSTIVMKDLSVAIDKAQKSFQNLKYRKDGSAIISSRNVKFLQSYEDTSWKQIPNQVERQTQALLESARIVLNIRGLLLKGNIEQAGAESVRVLSNQNNLDYELHLIVRQELELYANEISEALSLTNLWTSVTNAIASGDIQRLSKELQDIVESGAVNRFRKNLGVMRFFQRTNEIFTHWKDSCCELLSLRHSFDLKLLRASISKAKMHNVQGPLLNEAINRAETLHDFEKTIEDIKTSGGGTLTQRRASLKLVVELASHYNLENHPLSKKASKLLQMTPGCLRTLTICDAILSKEQYIIATESIRLKRAYLTLDSSKEKYKLENYPHLRDPVEFEMYHRHPLLTKSPDVALQNMLSNSLQQIPTSITTLQNSPILSALAVWSFTHVIRGIERNLFSSPEVQLRSLLHLGRILPPMRDEILLQVIKQIRGNKDNQSVLRLFKILGACVYYFPPSIAFENYLESFLIAETEATGMGLVTATAIATRGALAKQCIRFMHESIIRYGYIYSIDSNTVWDCCLKSLRQWLSDGDIPHLLPYYPQLPPLPEALGMLHSYYNDRASGGSDSLGNASSLSVSPSPSPSPSIFTPSNNKAAVIANISEIFVSDLAYNDHHHSAVPPSMLSSMAISNSLSDMFLSSGSPTVATTSSPTNGGNTLTHQIRGVKENWMKRFSYFAGSYINSRKTRAPTTLSEQDFATALADPRTPVDALDKCLLMYLIFGYERDLSLKYWNSIVRELQADKELLHFRSKAEEEGSRLRIDWLTKAIVIPNSFKDMSIEDIQFDDVVDEAKYFWMKYIDKLAAAATSQPELKWNVTVETIKGKLRIQNQEVALPTFEMPIVPSTGKSEINWELYHDLIITAMSLFVESKSESKNIPRSIIQDFQLCDM